MNKPAIAAGFALLLFLACSSAAAVRAQDQAPAYGANLLQNGDAEQDFGASDASKVVKPSGWEATDQFSVVQYGAKGEFPDHSAPGTIGGELNFFAGGMAPVSTATQKISLAPFSAAIDAGGVRYTLSGKLGGYGSREDNAAVSVTFADAGGAPLGSATIGPATAAQRLYNTAFLNLEQSGDVPKGARSATVKIVLTRVGDGYNHAFADVVSLVLAKAS